MKKIINIFEETLFKLQDLSRIQFSNWPSTRRTCDDVSRLYLCFIRVPERSWKWVDVSFFETCSMSFTPRTSAKARLCWIIKATLLMMSHKRTADKTSRTIEYQPKTSFSRKEFKGFNLRQCSICRHDQCPLAIYIFHHNKNGKTI